MKIFSIAVNIHDHNWYDGNLHYQAERYTRRKHNLNKDNSHDHTYSREFFSEYFIPNFLEIERFPRNRVFAFTVSNLGQQFVRDMLEETVHDLDFLDFMPENLWDNYTKDNYYYIDHHQSHAAYAYLHSRFKESDILAIDGRGWKFSCIFIDKTGKITDLTERLSIGGLWNRLAQDIGLGYLGAGKVMGLAGYGKYNSVVDQIINEYLESSNHKINDNQRKLIQSCAKEDIAFTLQYNTTELIKKYVYPLKSCDSICIAGGVAYNGYMNEEFTKYYAKVHVPPAVGDEGQSLGTYMHADYVLNNNIHVPSTYAGKSYKIKKEILKGLNYTKLSYDEVNTTTAKLIAEGKIIGWFQGKSESGNRALGNRSILADPRNPNIKDTINSKIKLREDFRPFAPSVLEEHYKDYFDTNQPSPFMSRIMPVISDKIPGVTHVDGTARIQTVTRKFNQRYYDLINEFYKITGIPMLLNTSFNCQEPVVESPEDAINTFNKCGLDYLVIEDYLIWK